MALLDETLKVYTKNYWEQIDRRTSKVFLPRGQKMARENRHFWLAPSAPTPEIFMFCGMRKDLLEPFEGPIDLPFECCYFEPMDVNIASLEVTVDDLGSKRSLEILSLLVQECQPKKYAFVINSHINNFGPCMASYSYLEDEDQRKEMYTLLSTITQEFCTHLASKTVDQGQSKAKIFFRKEGEYQKRKIKRVIYIGKRKSIEAKASRIVDWSHSWLVRGHWRKLDGGVGKDRGGMYSVKGFTWVIPHEKGEGTLVQKTRVIK